MHPRFVSAVLACALAILPAVAGAASTDVTLTTATGTLSGTLTVPDDARGRVPVGVIIAGSGNVDRDGNAPPVLTSRSYTLLAEALAARGIATLRYDKRGLKGSASALKPGTIPAFATFVDDADGWVTQLRADPRFSRVYTVGHSEGSLIALLGAQKTRVDGVISIAGAGEPLGNIIPKQLAAQGASAETVEATRKVIAAAIAGNAFEGDAPGPFAAFAKPEYRSFFQPWLGADPAAEAAREPAPLLVVQGDADIQITVDDAKRLAAAHPGAVLRILPHMTHILKDAAGTDRAASLATYTDAAAPVSAALVDAIFAFVFGPKPLSMR